VLGGRIQFFDFLKQGASRIFFGQTIFWGRRAQTQRK
jgi:hypothetical protein